MALSHKFIDAHIAHWEVELTSQYYPHRKHWPSALYHHAPLENAVAILTEGRLRSRNDPKNLQPTDVAAPGVISAQSHAHDWVRLYFRPKTPTQYHIEGIRKEGECFYGSGTHAPVLVMFVLDAKSVLLQNGVKFCDRNMQVGSADPSDTEEYFSNIPFLKVFHEGNTGGDDTIKHHRCAEVLARSPLVLKDCLKAILFRSEPERDTVLFRLASKRREWEPLCRVSDELKIFEKKYTFFQEISITNSGVLFSLNTRFDQQPISIKIEVFNNKDDLVGDFNNANLAARPPSGGKWIFRGEFPDGRYLVRGYLEGKFAYENYLKLGNTLF